MTASVLLDKYYLLKSLASGTFTARVSYQERILGTRKDNKRDAVSTREQHWQELI